MIIDSITRDNEKVIIGIDSDLGTCAPVYQFSFDCQDQEHAELLTRHLIEEWEKTNTEIAREAHIYGKPGDISALKKQLIDHWDGRNHCYKP